MSNKNDSKSISVFEDDMVNYSPESGTSVELPSEENVIKKAKRRRTPNEKARYHVQLVSQTGESRKFAAERGKITSLGTQRTYCDSIRTMFQVVGREEIGEAKKIDTEFANDYLQWRSLRVKQKTLDVDRLALSKVFHLDLPFVASAIQSNLTSRAYTEAQMELVAEETCPKIALSIRLCFFSGLRAHETITILPLEEQAVSLNRDWWPEQFDGMPPGKVYTVVGKGGLVRPVNVPTKLAQELELFRLPNLKSVRDRKIYYRTHYDLVSGQNLSQKFCVKSQEVLGWSSGLHGLRHSYAQNRMRSLLALGYPFSVCMAIVSRELGHYRSDITKAYLR